MPYIDETAEEKHALRIACDHLVRGCEGAISELRGATCAGDEQPPVERRAERIAAKVLSSWRDALTTLKNPNEPMPIAVDSLDNWTTEELIAEALKRSTGDAPALRLMQQRTLQAQLTA